MIDEFIKEMTDISTRYENWFECTCVFTAIKEINKLTGSGVDQNSIFIRSLSREKNKVKFTFLKLLCMGCNTFTIDKKLNKATILDNVNQKYYIEMEYNNDKSYHFVDELCDYLLDHNLINFNKNKGYYAGETHHIMHKLLNRLSKEDKKSYYKKFYENLTVEQQEYLSYKSFMIGASIFKDVETRDFIEKSAFKIEPPVNFINKNDLDEIHIFFNYSARSLSTCKNNGIEFIELCKLDYSSSATHIYIETLVMKDKMESAVPIMLKIINDTIHYYNGDFGWLELGKGVLSRKILKNLIKV